MAKRSKTEAAESKVKSAVALGALGARIAGPVGGGIGAITGLIIGDEKTVFPIDMVAIPAFQASMIEGNPSFMIYIKAGETLVPTGGNVLDMQENMDIEPLTVVERPKGVKKSSAYNKAYSKAFNEIKDTYKTKSGSWKKNGFSKAVKAAHKIAASKTKVQSLLKRRKK